MKNQILNRHPKKVLGLEIGLHPLRAIGLRLKKGRLGQIGRTKTGRLSFPSLFKQHNAVAKVAEDAQFFIFRQL